MFTPIFFRPPGAWVGDVIPWVEGHTAHLFYLYERRASPKPGTPWHLVTTSDGVRFADCGQALPAGGPDAPDRNAYTGSIVLDAEGVHHLFYTGQNPAITGSDGRPLQVVMHATSTDRMVTWVKRDEAIGAPAGYETGDWRDPFVFRDDDAGLWRMLIAARHDRGPRRRRGVIAQCVSQDLTHWELAEPFWDPRRYVAHECPEVFRIGGWWYLVYSEFSDAFVTRYRMSRSLAGPWIAPEFDTLDGRAYYAAKSADLAGRRLFFGWIATREGSHDAGAWQWAGTMSVVEATQRPDGTLDFRTLPELSSAFQRTASLGLDSGAALRLAAPDNYASQVSTLPLPEHCLVRAVIDLEPGTRECGLLLRASADGETGYVVRLEPGRGRMVFDRWPRTVTGTEQWQISGDVPFAIELERPCELEPGRHTLDIVLSSDICVIGLDSRVVLSTRVYDHPVGNLGFFVADGAATLVDVEVRAPALSHEESVPNALDGILTHRVRARRTAAP